MIFLLSDMKTGLFFLLLSGVVLVSCSFTRHFRYVNKRLTWSDAQLYCRKHFTDLATIQDSDQLAKANVVAGSGVVWLGLYKHWEWTVEHEGGKPLTGFRNWGSGEQFNKPFVVISGDGKWSTRGQDQQYPVICYKAKTDSHFLVPDLLNWGDARRRCRSMSAELSIIRDQQENMIVAALLTNQDKGFSYSQAWIGLSRSRWKWQMFNYHSVC
ncbi:C-type lectin-like [Sphaeramia orbicularis]|uniref:C-type lectin-like n=1 Tax=Sphaeramia orbicularis TaxID=375764 RepID=UPI00117F1732|nr:C-type lectin-like [Sphaeramia orbicularis]